MMKEKVINKYKTLKKLQEENEDYKSRVEKAIKYIKEHIRIDDEYPAYMEMLVEERDNLLNILNGENDKSKGE